MDFAAIHGPLECKELNYFHCALCQGELDPQYLQRI